MVNYANAKVYKIVGPDDNDECYIGSTVQFEQERFTGHKYDYKCWKLNTSTKYLSSFKLFDKHGVSNCRILVLENCKVSSKIELLQREQYYIKTHKCVNQINAHTTTDERKASKKAYRDKHKQIRVKTIDPITGIIHITTYESDGVTLAAKKRNLNPPKKKIIK